MGNVSKIKNLFFIMKCIGGMGSGHYTAAIRYGGHPMHMAVDDNKDSVPAEGKVEDSLKNIDSISSTKSTGQKYSNDLPASGDNKHYEGSFNRLVTSIKNKFGIASSNKAGICNPNEMYSNLSLEQKQKVNTSVGQVMKMLS